MPMRFGNLMSMKLTFTKVSDEIFTAVSDAPYWSDGNPINERLAFAGEILSNTKAQSLDRKNGNGYLLVSFFCIKSPEIISSARALRVGESFSINRS